MTLFLIAGIVFLIIWACQVGNKKGAQAEEKRLTKTNVELEREVAKRELDRILKNMDVISPNITPFDFLVSLHEKECIPLDNRYFLSGERNDPIEKRVKETREDFRNDNEYLSSSISWDIVRGDYKSTFEKYWLLEDVGNKTMFAEEEIKQSVNEFLRLYEKVFLRVYRSLDINKVYSYGANGRMLEDNWFIDNVTGEEILNLSRLPPLEDIYFEMHNNDPISKIVFRELDPNNTQMLLRILLNDRIAYDFSEFFHYGIMKREMHKLGYAVSSDGIHESDWQEREKENKKHEEEKEKYPWMYHENKYVNSNKDYWKRMK